VEPLHVFSLKPMKLVSIL
jgi:hypothetical protein